MANSEVEILSRNETKARARLESAKTNLHGVRKQLDEKLASLAASGMNTVYGDISGTVC